ncbi:MAG: hypothetical protein AAFX93_11840 [Verrucomicrobiota bacterium]
MEIDLRWPVIFLANALLIALVRMVNDALAPYGIYLVLTALLLIVPALHLPPRWGILLSFGTALLYGAPYLDDITPLMFVFGLGYVIFRQFGSQLRRFRRAQLLTSLVVANTLLVILQGFLFSDTNPGSNLVYMQRVVSDSLLSAVVLYPVGYWFIDLQYTCLVLLGVDPRADDPPE